MTVEKWLRGNLQGIGEEIELPVLEVAVDSTGDLEDKRFMAISLEDEKDDHKGDKVFQNSLWYALSTLLYAMSSATNTGQRREKRGNRDLSLGGRSYTTSDRERYRSWADEIRRKLGLEIGGSEAAGGGMFDASGLITKNPAWR